MEKNNKILVFLCLFFFAFYFVIGTWFFVSFGIVNNGQDFQFHYLKSRGEVSGNYSPLYHLIMQPFVSSQLLFYFVNLVVIVGFIPFLLFKLANSVWAVIIYFFGVGLPHQMICNATFPEAIVLLLFLFYLTKRKLFWFVPLAFLASFFHSKGFLLFLGIFVIEFLLRRFGLEKEGFL